MLLQVEHLRQHLFSDLFTQSRLIEEKKWIILYMTSSVTGGLFSYMCKKQILIVDDDIYIGNLLEEVLSKENYKVLRAYSGTEAQMLLSSVRPDLILLDLMLPGLSGETLLPRIKEIPIIVVSAKADTDSKVRMLTDGAVDYVTKPFDIKELLARIALRLRSTTGYEPPTLTFSNLSLNTDTHTLQAGENIVRLTRTEYAILKLFMQNPGRVLTKSRLLDSIAIDTPDCTESSLKIHISHLRKKLYQAAGREYIEAVWGIGFQLKDG